MTALTDNGEQQSGRERHNFSHDDGVAAWYSQITSKMNVDICSVYSDVCVQIWRRLYVIAGLRLFHGSNWNR